ncbi:MAG: hypothetical protein AAF352_02565 [Pseudomonadota bacterium]
MALPHEEDDGSCSVTPNSRSLSMIRANITGYVAGIKRWFYPKTASTQWCISWRIVLGIIPERARNNGPWRRSNIKRARCAEGNSLFLASNASSLPNLLRKIAKHHQALNMVRAGVLPDLFNALMQAVHFRVCAPI